jgi:hypothetical protein
MVRHGRQLIHHRLEKLQFGRIAVAFLRNRLPDMPHQIRPKLTLDALILQGC